MTSVTLIFQRTFVVRTWSETVVMGVRRKISSIASSSIYCLDRLAFCQNIILIHTFAVVFGIGSTFGSTDRLVIVTGGSVDGVVVTAEPLPWFTRFGVFPNRRIPFGWISIRRSQTQISQRELAPTSLRLRLLEMEFARCILVAAGHTTSDEQHIRQSYLHRQ